MGVIKMPYEYCHDSQHGFIAVGYLRTIDDGSGYVLSRYLRKPQY